MGVIYLPVSWSHLLDRIWGSFASPHMGDIYLPIYGRANGHHMRVRQRLPYACLALTMCHDLEKLHSDVALLAEMQRYFQAACAMIGYVRDAWAQYWR